MWQIVKNMRMYFHWRGNTNEHINREISIDNLNAMFYISFIMVILELFALFTFIFRDEAIILYMQRALRILFCIVSCFIIMVLTYRMRQLHHRQQKINFQFLYATLLIFYILLTAWGIWCDVKHYIEGTQMLTFYIVQFCFASFVVLQPVISTVMFTGGFISLMITVLVIDGGHNIEIQNLITYMLITVIGSYVRYVVAYHQKQEKETIHLLNKKLAVTVKYDDLTGLKNRYALRIDFNDYLEQEVIVMMCDIDKFKEYNDTYGHLIGDAVLKEISKVIGDIFSIENSYRYGGDEFLIILKDISIDRFLEKVQLFKERIHEIKIDAVDHPISCSYGYEHAIVENEDDLRHVIQIADNQLYDDKDNNQDNEIAKIIA